VKLVEAFFLFFFSLKGKWKNRFDHINFRFGRKDTCSGVSRDGFVEISHDI